MDERTVFLTALEKTDPAQRAAFLSEACVGDDALRQRVDALLRTYDDAGSFLEHPPEDCVAPTIVPQVETPDGSISLDFLAPSSKPGCLGVLDHYEVLQAIGRGGFGIVLKARDTKLERIVAIKMLAPELAANGLARKRFLREAKAAAAVAHPHVVAIHSIDEQRPYLVMEFIEGQSLKDKIDRTGTLELKEILRIGAQVASGLAEAHKQGLIHRDVKPANILLENGVQRVKLTDFGLARAVDDIALTRTGEVAGTPQFMSPEQAQGAIVDHRSDLFSLGSVLYTMCTGRSPFRGDTTMAVIRRVCDDTPRPIRETNREVPEWLCDIIDKLLEKTPADRFQTAQEVSDLLAQHLAHEQQPWQTAQPVRVARKTVAKSRETLQPLQWPAIGLLATGLLNCLVLIPLWFDPSAVLSNGPQLPGGPHIFVLALIMGNAVMLWGGVRMRRGMSYGLCVTASLLAIVIVTRMFPIGCLAGLWALVVLNRPEVRALFQRQTSAGPTHSKRSRPVRGWQPALIAIVLCAVAFWWFKSFTSNASDLERRIESAREQLASTREQFRVGAVPATAVTEAEIRVTETELRLAEAEHSWLRQDVLYDRLLEEYRRLHSTVQDQFNMGTATAADVRRAKSQWLEIASRRDAARAVNGVPPTMPALVEKTVDPRTGTLIVQSDDPDVQLDVDGKRVELRGRDALELPLLPGGHAVTYTKDEKLLHQQAVEVRRGRNEVVRWTSQGALVITDAAPGLVHHEGHTLDPRSRTMYLPGAPTNGKSIYELVADQQAGWRPLFNGRDLSGWKSHPDEPGQWRVENGILVGSDQPGYLYSERDDFTDFHLRCEVRISAGGDSGVIVRAPFERATKNGLPGYEAQIQAGPALTAGWTTGAISSSDVVAGWKLQQPAQTAVAPEEWFELVIIAQGNHVETWLDGREVAEYTDPERRFARGRIALQQSGSNTRVMFRKIEVRELAPSSNSTPVDFNGRWTSQWGDVELQHPPVLDQQPVELTGTYYNGRGGIKGTIDPKLRTMLGTFDEGVRRGKIRLVLSADNNHIVGHYGFNQPGGQDDPLTTYTWDMPRQIATPTSADEPANVR